MIAATEPTKMGLATRAGRRGAAGYGCVLVLAKAKIPSWRCLGASRLVRSPTTATTNKRKIAHANPSVQSQESTPSE